MPPITATPPAAGPGLNMAQLGAPTTTPQPGALSGQAPAAAPAPPAPTPTPTPTPPPAAAPSKAPYSAMSPEEYLKQSKPYGDELDRRAKALLPVFYPGPGASLELQHEGRKAAYEAAEKQMAPHFMQMIATGQYQAARTNLGEEGIKVKEGRAVHQNAKDDATADLSKTKMALEPFRVGALEQRANAAALQANSSSIMRAAMTGSIEQSTALAAIDVQHKLADFATKGNAGAITSMFQTLPIELQDLLRPAFGNVASPATEQGREAFQRSLKVGQTGAPLPTAPPLPPVASNNVTPSMLSQVAGAARGMPPITATPEEPPLAGAAGMPAGVPNVTAMNGMAPPIATFRPGAGGPPGMMPPGGHGPNGQAGRPGPRQVTDGLNKPANEASAMIRLRSTHQGMDDRGLRALYQRAMRILANPEIHTPAAMAKANSIVHGDQSPAGAVK